MSWPRPVALCAAVTVLPAAAAAAVASRLAADLSFYLLAAPRYALVRVRLHRRVEPIG